jgi:hypothetical protein
MSRFVPIAAISLFLGIVGFAGYYVITHPCSAPRDKLSSAAKKHGYAASDDGVIFVPVTTVFPPAKIAEWRKASVEMGVSAEAGISQISVRFSKCGKYIVGVNILWEGNPKTISLPYDLSADETVQFVQEATVAMGGT